VKVSQEEVAEVVARHCPAALAFLRSLVEENSFTGNAEGVEANAEIVRKQFAPFGWREEVSPCALPGTGRHLILDSSADAPAVLLVSHLDTVYSPEEQAGAGDPFLEKDGRVCGPGVYDIKGGTAMMWLVLRALEEIAPEAWRAIRWVGAWNAAEERLPSDFSTWCLSHFPSPSAVLVFEGDNRASGGFEIVTGRSGISQYRLECHGKGTHAGNAHEAGLNAILGLAEKLLEISTWTDYKLETTVNVGVIRGGECTNRVPDRAEAWLEIRYTDRQDFADKALRLSEVAAAGAKSGPLFLEELNLIPPLVPSDGSRSLAEHWIGAGRAQGFEVTCGGRRGLSDANFFAGHASTLDGLGPQGGNPHGLNRIGDSVTITEFLDLSSFAAKAELNLLALLRLARTLQGRSPEK